MKVVFMTGNHPRHAFLARAVAASGFLSGLVIERREAFVPEPPSGLRPHTSELFHRHFRDRDASEQRFFGTAEFPTDGISTLKIDVEELDGPVVHDFLRQTGPTLLLSYGVHKLSAETLGCVDGLHWNIHGGLSPWYRGTVTHFWPSYFLEPQMTGMTVHETTAAIDGGGIVHQTLSPLVAGDGIHDLACRAVLALGEAIPQLMAATAAGRIAPPVQQATTGRIWRSQDWRPEHLHVIYDAMENRVVDRYLAGEFATFAPKIIRQF